MTKQMGTFKQRVLISLAALGFCVAGSSPAFASDGTIIILAYFGIIALLLAIVFIPTFVAFRRNHPNRWVVFVVNLAVGGTVIGWFAVLIWALHYAHKSEHGSNGGESGLNIFINDTKSVRIEPVMNRPSPPEAPTPDRFDDKNAAVAKLRRLKTLFDDGAISSTEYAALKQPILNHYILATE